MEFALTFEQSALKDGVARFVADAHGFEEAMRLARTDAGHSPEHWKQFAGLGWLALLVSEENGGLGATPVEAALVMEEMGRGLVAAPLISTAVLAALLLDRPAPLPERQRLLVERLVAGEAVVALAAGAASEVIGVRATRAAQGFRLSGHALLCIDGGIADEFIVAARLDEAGAAGLALFLVRADAPGLARRAYRTIDARTAADLRLDEVQVEADALLHAAPAAAAALERALDAARLMLAAEALGIMEAAIRTTIEYLQTRKQFGRALASYQVLTHRVSDMLVRKEHARSLLYRGLAHLEAPAPARAAAVSATMAGIVERGEFIGAQAIQLHGGIGMADEYVVGHHYKRLRAIGKTYGDLGWHLGRFMDAAQDLQEEVAA